MLLKRFRQLKKYDPEKERALQDEIEAAGGLEKNDVKAMILAAMLTIMPFIVLLFLLIVLFCWMFVN